MGLDNRDLMTGNLFDSIVEKAIIVQIYILIARARTVITRQEGLGGIAAPPSYGQELRVWWSRGTITRPHITCSLQKAGGLFLKAYASKPVRQADIREFGSA